MKILVSVVRFRPGPPSLSNKNANPCRLAFLFPEPTVLVPGPSPVPSPSRLSIDGKKVHHFSDLGGPIKRVAALPSGTSENPVAACVKLADWVLDVLNKSEPPLAGLIMRSKR